MHSNVYIIKPECICKLYLYIVEILNLNIRMNHVYLIAHLSVEIDIQKDR